jgi:hypothetical protein
VFWGVFLVFFGVFEGFLRFLVVLMCFLRFFGDFW